MTHVTPTSAATPTPHSRAGRNLPSAIGVGVALSGAALITLRWFHWGFVGITALALALGAVEVNRAMSRIGMTAAVKPIVAAAFLIPLGSYWAARHPESGLSSNALLLAMLALTVLVALVWRLPGGPQGFVKDAAASVFIIGYLPLLGSAVALMLAGDLGAQRIVAFLFCVIANDTGGYLFGVLFGRTPMAPTISPKKTWEGFAGSVISGVAVGVLMATWLLHVDWWVGVVLGVTMVAFGTAGDLIESMIKRDVGIKDMSSFLPGHGGIMDRLDSLLVAAPVAWLVMYLFVPGG
ncbi:MULTISPECIES: phosphatidate cytidylyltransferase [Aestuariimicrobium]|uniref:phosphatidate cytidylyltransferase n=1 Tax=Aestuariimicrobium TaxID=396388 RepID=UPI00047D3ADD|nr:MULTISPECIES: phosphatidate cytidylyltransferase [Aestuariimicrobium]CAI9398961.1 Phosphatidate cytidylyltransferase [Aestuariimicrobium sp. T2.26MG-19.2B]